jgi:cobalt-zinc-cadmium resistance protein CzcA
MEGNINQEKAFRSLSLAVIFAIFLVFMLIYITLGSISVTLLIMITLPAALAGGIIAMFITGTSLNVPSSIGFIALMGIAVQNSLVLFTNIKEMKEHGITGREAIIKESVVRVRTKL